jgi:hypothetical protein
VWIIFRANGGGFKARGGIFRARGGGFRDRGGGFRGREGGFTPVAGAGKMRIWRPMAEAGFGVEEK